MKILKLLIKLILSLTLLIFLFHKVDINQFKDILLRIGLCQFLILSALYILSQIISSIRWGFVIESLGSKMKLSELVKAYFLGMYANLFLPSIIGGDGIKAYVVSKHLGLRKAISTIFLERYNGLAALLFIALISVLAFHRFFNYKIIALILSVNIAIYIPLFAMDFKIFTKYEKIKNFCSDIKIFHKSGYFIKVSILSVFVQLIVIFIYILAGKMLGFNINWAYYFAFIPIINLISFLPISFNGIGIREFSFVYFFSFAGLSKLDALSLSIDVFFVVIFCSLVGGGFYFIFGRKTFKESKEFYRQK